MALWFSRILRGPPTQQQLDRKIYIGPDGSLSTSNPRRGNRRMVLVNPRTRKIASMPLPDGNATDVAELSSPELEHMRQLVVVAEDELARTHASISWRITRPLRSLRTALAPVFNRFRSR